MLAPDGALSKSTKEKSPRSPSTSLQLQPFSGNRQYLLLGLTCEEAMCCSFESLHVLAKTHHLGLHSHHPHWYRSKTLYHHHCDKYALLLYLYCCSSVAMPMQRCSRRLARFNLLLRQLSSSTSLSTAQQNWHCGISTLRVSVKFLYRAHLWALLEVACIRADDDSRLRRDLENTIQQIWWNVLHNRSTD